MTITDGRVYMAWKGVDGDANLWINQRTSVEPWSAPQPCNGTFESTGGIAVAGPGDQHLYMAWKRPGSDQQIWWSRLADDSAAWSRQAEVRGARSSVGPAMAAWAGQLLMAWKGVDGDDRIWWNAYERGQWTTPNFIPGSRTSFAPALAKQHIGAAGQIVMVWKGVHGDDRIWTSHYLGTNRWSPPTAIDSLGRNCGGGVALAGSRNGELHMVWKGKGDDPQIYWSQLAGEHTWTPQIPIAGALTNIGPALAIDAPATPCMTWKGVSDHHIWWSRREHADHWSTPKVIDGANTSFRPALTTTGI